VDNADQRAHVVILVPWVLLVLQDQLEVRDQLGCQACTALLALLDPKENQESVEDEDDEDLVALPESLVFEGELEGQATPDLPVLKDQKVPLDFPASQDEDILV